MLTDAPLVAFVPVTDLARAREFYEGVLGLRVVEANPFTIVIDANGTTLRLTHVPDLRPQPFTICGWAVDHLEAELDRLVGAGVIFSRFEGMGQDDRGIWTAPGGDRIAWFPDPDGNTLSLSHGSVT